MAARSLRFRVYRDRKKGWRWTLFGLNGKVMADSGESYKAKAGAVKAVATILRLAASAVIEVEDARAAPRRRAVK